MCHTHQPEHAATSDGVLVVQLAEDDCIYRLPLEQVLAPWRRARTRGKTPRTTSCATRQPGGMSTAGATSPT